jgi:hypothetical protein
MSIGSMGVRSAIRSAQNLNLAGAGPLVTGIAVGSPGFGQTVVQPTPPTKNMVSTFLDSLTGWIPTEAIAMFVGLAGAFSVFDDPTKEYVLGGLVAVVAAAYAAGASASAQRKSGITTNIGWQATKTAIIAVIAFVAWWIAMPGSFFTADLGIAPFYAAIVLAVVAIGVPFLAKLMKVEPLKQPA